MCVSGFNETLLTPIPKLIQENCKENKGTPEDSGCTGHDYGIIECENAGNMCRFFFVNSPIIKIISKIN